jgi:hypothetical protein
MPYAPIPAPAIGGAVLAILLRHKLRTQALGKLQQEQGAFKPPVAWVADIPVSVKTQESYTFAADVTEHAAESGAIFADHVILRPIKIDLSFEVTNWEAGTAQRAFDLLEALWKSRQPVDLLTRHKTLNSMVLTSLDATNALPSWGALIFRATFKQIKLVTLETKSVPAEKVKVTEKTGGPDMQKSAETKTDEGNKSLGTTVIDALTGFIK